MPDPETAEAAAEQPIPAESEQAMPNEVYEQELVQAMSEEEVRRRQEADEKMKARLDEDYPESWRPEAEGDSIRGVLVDVTTGPASWAGETRQVPILVVEELLTAVKRSVWLIHAVLENEVRSAGPQRGETIGIRYLGKQESKHGGPPYENYRVEVDRGQSGGVVDWDKIGIEPAKSQTKGDDLPGLGEPGPGDADIPFLPTDC